MEKVTTPVSLVAGWYDIFVPGQLRDHLVLQGARRSARLTVGPWTHASLAAEATALREALDFGMAHARGDEPSARAPVRLYVMGEENWRDFPSWPPPGYRPQRMYFPAAGRAVWRCARGLLRSG